MRSALTDRRALRVPQWKRQAIERLGFGPIEKIVLLFDKRFWDDSTDFFGCLPPPELSHDELSARRGEFFMFWNLDRSHGVPALLCVSSGAFAVNAWRSHSYKGVVNKALAVLRRTFGSVATSSYKRSVVSDWGRNPYARGSYSYVAVSLEPPTSYFPSHLTCYGIFLAARCFPLPSGTSPSAARVATTTSWRGPSASTRSASSSQASTPTASTRRPRRAPSSRAYARRSASTSARGPASRQRPRSVSG